MMVKIIARKRNDIFTCARQIVSFAQMYDTINYIDSVFLARESAQLSITASGCDIKSTVTSSF